MKVKELIERLKCEDDDTEVIFADYEPVVDVVSLGNEDDGKQYVVITDVKSVKGY